MEVLSRHHVVVRGRLDAPPILFAHGFGCDQNMWRHVAPAFEQDHRVVLFDHEKSPAPGRWGLLVERWV